MWLIGERARRLAILSVTSGAASLALGVSGAQAIPVTTVITTPSDNSFLVQNLDTNPSQTFTVSGTANGGTSAVDIVCYQGGNPVGGGSPVSYNGPTNHGVPVTSGTFSAPVPQSDFSGYSCQLLAIPEGTTPPSNPTTFTGPRVGFSEFYTSKQTSNPDTGRVYDFYFGDSTSKAESFIYSANDCGPGANLLDGTTAMTAGPFLLDCAGSFYNSPADYWSTNSSFDLSRADMEVDGQPAYGSKSADYLYPSNPGTPSVSASLTSFDTSNGNAVTTDVEPMVKCDPNNVWHPSTSDCASFAPDGVSLDRVTKFSDGGRVQTVTDTYSSTDGKAHTLDLRYETDLQQSTAGWQLPGESGFSHKGTGSTGSTPSSAPGTIYAIDDTSHSPTLANPVAAMTYASPYSSVLFDNTLWATYNTTGEESALIDYHRQVAPGAPVTLSWSYATEPTLAAVQGDAAAAKKALAAPKIKFTSPKSRAKLHSRRITVKGTAKAPSGLSTVTVDKRKAKLAGSHWTAKITLKKGKNKITVVATSQAGTTSKATRRVSYRPKKK